MKKLNLWLLASLFVAALTLTACSKDDDEKKNDKSKFQNLTFTVGDVEFTMVAVKGGTFQMGAADDDADAYDDEKPQHAVTLSDYYIGETEVTQELWDAVMSYKTSINKGEKLPVEYVVWNDCQYFITTLNNMTGKEFRLPTEAEWEYAARGGNKSKGYKYSGSNDIDIVAWYLGNSEEKTHDVATKTKNELGLYDMTGNVMEWCQDWYGEYSSEAQTDPTGPESGSKRVCRGGNWGNFDKNCRVSVRKGCTKGYSHSDLGFRLAMSKSED